jgi:hypothetical protein
MRPGLSAMLLVRFREMDAGGKANAHHPEPSAVKSGKYR